MNNDKSISGSTYVNLDEHKRLLEPKPDHPRYPHSIFGYRNKVRLVKRFASLAAISKCGSLFQNLIQMTWWQLLGTYVFFYTCEHLLFGALYFIDYKGINGLTYPDSLTWCYFDCVNLSVQSALTIGYGRLNPNSIWTNIVVFIQMMVATITTAFITGLAFIKIARPDRIARQYLFSDVAVINYVAVHYEGGADSQDLGKYAVGCCPCLQIRFSNTRKAALNDAQFRLLLLQKLNEDADGACEYKTHELDYDLHWQIGRVRGASMSMPVLPLPMTITHAINEWSPLYGVTEEKLQQSNLEIIAVLDGTDEFAANTCQVRYSWNADNLKWNHKFVNCVYECKSRKGPRFEVALEKLSETVPC